VGVAGLMASGGEGDGGSGWKAVGGRMNMKRPASRERPDTSAVGIGDKVRRVAGPEEFVVLFKVKSQGDG